MSDQTWPSPDQPFRAIHRFKVGGGEEIVDGKSYRPNFLRVEMDKRQGWRLVMELLTRIQQDEDLVDLSFVGKMEEDDE